MVKRILLHIGTHKTGTSALQRVFEDERAVLAEAGIWYPATHREPFGHLPKHSSLHASTKEPARFQEEIRVMRAEATDAGCETMLISAEGFSEPAFDKFAVFATLPKGIELHVFAYLRRQDQFIESLWNQYVKQGREGRSVAVFSNAPAIRARADYTRILDFWSGMATVHVSDYAAAKSKGIVAHFAEFAGLPNLNEAPFANPSLGMNEALVRSWFIARDMKVPKKLQDAMRGDQRRLALGRELRKKLIAEFADVNADLARRYGVAFTNDLPEEPDQPLTSPDPEFLVALLNRLTTAPAVLMGMAPGARLAPARAEAKRRAAAGAAIAGQRLAAPEAPVAAAGTSTEVADAVTEVKSATRKTTKRAKTTKPGKPAKPSKS